MTHGYEPPRTERGRRPGDGHGRVEIPRGRPSTESRLEGPAEVMIDPAFLRHVQRTAGNAAAASLFAARRPVPAAHVQRAFEVSISPRLDPTTEGPVVIDEVSVHDRPGDPTVLPGSEAAGQKRHIITWDVVKSKYERRFIGQTVKQAHDWLVARGKAPNALTRKSVAAAYESWIRDKYFSVKQASWRGSGAANMSGGSTYRGNRVEMLSFKARAATLNPAQKDQFGEKIWLTFKHGLDLPPGVAIMDKAQKADWIRRYKKKFEHAFQINVDNIAAAGATGTQDYTADGLIALLDREHATEAAVKMAREKADAAARKKAKERKRAKKAVTSGGIKKTIAKDPPPRRRGRK